MDADLAHLVNSLASRAMALDTLRRELPEDHSGIGTNFADAQFCVVANAIGEILTTLRSKGIITDIEARFIAGEEV